MKNRNFTIKYTDRKTITSNNSVKFEKVNKIQRKLKIEQYEPYLKTGATAGVAEV
jgi:hypothetical protein